MNTLTKLALGLMGQLKPLPPVGDAAPLRTLLPPSLSGGMPLISALSGRRSLRDFAPEPLAEQVLSDLLWAARCLRSSHATASAVTVEIE